MSNKPQVYEAFAWPVYADATLAGLAVLVPLPGLDWLLEERFRRRMPVSIARHRGRVLSPAVAQALNTSNEGCLASGVGLILRLPLELLKLVSRKLLYFLSIKAATEKLSYYWQRAYLMDYMLAAGHLATPPSAQRARQAMERVLRETPTPMTHLARVIARNTAGVVQLLRRDGDALAGDALHRQRATMSSQWWQYAGELRTLAARYERAYTSPMPDSGAAM